jgi:hypothetical protein
MPFVSYKTVQLTNNESVMSHQNLTVKTFTQANLLWDLTMA